MSKTIEIRGYESDDAVTEKLDAAIFRSVAFNEIPHVFVEAGTAEEAETTLSVMADDSVVTQDREGRRMVEAWGTNDDGADWRIHLHIRGEIETAERRSDRSTF